MTQIVLYMIAVFTLGQQAATSGAPVARVEGCVSCHTMIEPMHKYGTTEPFEKLKDGKDAVGLSCTACHGGNPATKLKEQAHVKPKFPDEWRRAGNYSGANP